MTAVAAESVAEAPAVGAAKPMTPPSTGLTNWPTSWAATVKTSGLANAAPALAVCGVLPLPAVRVRPWLWKAPMSAMLAGR